MVCKDHYRLGHQLCGHFSAWENFKVFYCSQTLFVDRGHFHVLEHFKILLVFLDMIFRSDNRLRKLSRFLEPHEYHYGPRTISCLRKFSRLFSIQGHHLWVAENSTPLKVFKGLMFTNTICGLPNTFVPYKIFKVFKIFADTNSGLPCLRKFARVITVCEHHLCMANTSLL